MKYQIRINDTMANIPASGLLDTYAEAEEALIAVKEEIRNTWATPDVNAAYIAEIHCRQAFNNMDSAIAGFFSSIYK